MKREISYNFSYIRSHNIYSTKVLKNPSFWGKFLDKRGRLRGEHSSDIEYSPRNDIANN